MKRKASSSRRSLQVVALIILQYYFCGVDGANYVWEGRGIGGMTGREIEDER